MEESSQQTSQLINSESREAEQDKRDIPSALGSQNGFAGTGNDNIGNGASLGEVEVDCESSG